MVKLPDYIKKEYPFKTNFFKIDNLDYHYIDEGEGKPIIFVHGNPTWSFYFRDLVKELSKKRRCIAIDNIGHGLSSKPKHYKYTLSNHGKNLEKLVKHLNLKEIDLVMHDWGVAIGTFFAINNPHLVNSLTIINGSFIRSKFMPRRIGILRFPVIGRYLIQVFNIFAYFATIMTVEKKLSKDKVKSYLFPYSSFNNRVGVHGFVNDIPMSKRDKSYLAFKYMKKNFKNIKDKKVLLLWGLKDFCFGKPYFDKFLKIFKNVKGFSYEDGNHYLLEDKKDEVINRLKEFYNII
jgi:haloalkane dehalogenase